MIYKIEHMIETHICQEELKVIEDNEDPQNKENPKKLGSVSLMNILLLSQNKENPDQDAPKKVEIKMTISELYKHMN